MTDFVTRADEALRFTTTPTDVMRFLVEGGSDLPDITDETLAPGDGPPLHRHPCPRRRRRHRAHLSRSLE